MATRMGNVSWFLPIIVASCQLIGHGPSLINLMANWSEARPALEKLNVRVAAGEGQPVSQDQFAAPMPRSWQWLDGSAFPTHGDLMQVAFGLDPLDRDRPLMYQGVSDRFCAPTDDVPFVSMDHGIDFEGEFGIIVDHVPMGTNAKAAMDHIRLIVQINDWSLRAIAPILPKDGTATVSTSQGSTQSFGMWPLTFASRPVAALSATNRPQAKAVPTLKKRR